jgi:homeobox-leucine zipper protein
MPRNLFQPAFCRMICCVGKNKFKHHSCRGFNDAVNGFNDDGWSVLNCDGAEGVTISVNSIKNLSGTSNPASSLSLLGGIVCAKASMLLQVSA